MAQKRAQSPNGLIQVAMFDLPTPSMPTLDVSRVVTRPVSHETAANMVVEFHYAHRVPSIQVAYGMYVDNVLAGVVTYGVPANRNSDDICGEAHRGHVLELNRLFVHEWAGKNSESYIIGQSWRWMEQATPEWYIVISYADSAHDHIGKIYQATNWVYTGESVMSTEGWLINGRVYHPRTLSGILGSCAADVILKAYPHARPVKGEVKYRYVYFLGPRDRAKKLKASLKYPALPYPKVLAEKKHQRDAEGATIPDTTHMDADEAALVEGASESELLALLERPKKKHRKEVEEDYTTRPRACCNLALPMDCTCALAIDCPRHGQKHTQGCLQAKNAPQPAGKLPLDNP